MKLFLEHDDPNACRTAWEPSADDPEDVAAMAELGWQRIQYRHSLEEERDACHYDGRGEAGAADAERPTTDPNAAADPDDAPPAKPPSQPPVVQPCPEHAVEIDPGCPACLAWHNRDAKPAGEAIRIRRPVRAWVLDYMNQRNDERAHPIVGLNGVADAIVAYLDEQAEKR